MNLENYLVETNRFGSLLWYLAAEFLWLHKLKQCMGIMFLAIGNIMLQCLVCCIWHVEVYFDVTWAMCVILSRLVWHKAKIRSNSCYRTNKAHAKKKGFVGHDSDIPSGSDKAAHPPVPEGGVVCHSFALANWSTSTKDPVSKPKVPQKNANTSQWFHFQFSTKISN